MIKKNLQYLFSARYLNSKENFIDIIHWTAALSRFNTARIFYMKLNSSWEKSVCFSGCRPTIKNFILLVYISGSLLRAYKDANDLNQTNWRNEQRNGKKIIIES